MGIIRNDKGNRSIYKSFTAWLMLAVMTVSFAVTAVPYECFADEYEDKISSMQQKEAQTQQTISNLEKATQETKNSIAMLQQQKEASPRTVPKHVLFCDIMRPLGEKPEGRVAERWGWALLTWQLVWRGGAGLVVGGEDIGCEHRSAQVRSRQTYL